MKIHIAGFPVRVGDKLRQLCAWCGVPLIDDDLSLMMVAPGSSAALHTWETNALVAVEGNGKWTVPPDEDGSLPLQCCASQAPKLRAVPTPKEST